MAERIKAMLPRALYPWSEWMDGNAWEIERGKDFPAEMPLNNFVNAMHTKAKKKGMKVKTKKVGEKIQFQFYTPEEN